MCPLFEDFAGAEVDLTRELQVYRYAELISMAESRNSFTDKLRHMIVSLKGTANQLQEQVKLSMNQQLDKLKVRKPA